MDRSDVEVTCPLWPSQRLVVRLHYCRAMLWLAGVLTEGESLKVSRRIARISQALEREAGQAAPEVPR